MSKIALTPNASGTGTLTLAAPNTNTDRTLTLPDSAGTIATAESTLAQFNASGSAPVYACRAWVNFNGTGTVAIRASGNVSSITDNGTGAYTVNFTTAMPDVNYSPIVSLGLVEAGSSGRNIYAGFNNQGGTVYSSNTNNIRMMIATMDDGITQVDCDFIYVSIFR